MSRRLVWFPEAWKDYIYWQHQDKKTLRRINTLLDAAVRDPFLGIGMQEPLKNDLAGYWSRRIDHKNRIIYAVEEDTITVISCRYHYGNT